MARLADARLPLAQRQALVASVGRIHGNAQVSRMIARATASTRVIRRDNPPAAAPGAAPGAAGGPPVGLIAQSQALQARAQEVLKNVYGSIKPIVPTPVQMVDEATFWQRFDEMQIRHGARVPHAAPPDDTWTMGAGKKVFSDLFGFADRDNNVIYVPQGGGGGSAGEQLGTVVHEMLHTNAAGDWQATVGGSFDEGETEILTIKACASQHIANTAAYPAQRADTAQLEAVVGAGTLQSAYFGGGSILIAAFDAVRGEGMWTKLKQAMAESDPADRREKFDKILKAKTSSWANDKINIIRGIMSSWWVSDEDVARIVAICGTASPEDLKLLQAAIGPEVSNLNNEGQRARIRIALGM